MFPQHHRDPDKPKQPELRADEEPGSGTCGQKVCGIFLFGWVGVGAGMHSSEGPAAF